jgi:hypothetical protein
VQRHALARLSVGIVERIAGDRVPELGQVHEVVAGGLYMSHSDYEASFAMGKADSATLVIDWPLADREDRPQELPQARRALHRMPAFALYQC